MDKKEPVKPVWWKNTFFLFGVALLVLALWGLIKGEKAIRDPGQIAESGLVLFYLLGGILMLGNGWMTHQQNMQAYDEEMEMKGISPSKAESPKKEVKEEDEPSETQDEPNL